MKKIQEIRITQVTLFKEVNCDMCHNFYWLIKCQLKIDEERLYRARFIVWHDIYDYQDFLYEEDEISDEEYDKLAKAFPIKAFATELAYNFISQFPAGTNAQKIVNSFNATIEDFYK